MFFRLKINQNLDRENVHNKIINKYFILINSLKDRIIVFLKNISQH